MDPVRLPDCPFPIPKRQVANVTSNTARKSKGTCALVSLGCPKNLVDSERMLGLLESGGFEMVSSPHGAGFVVVNTCGFIEEARRESLDVIGQMLRLKEEGKVGGVIVAGCLAQRDGPSLLEAHPGIDQVVGVFSRDTIGEAAERLMRGSPPGCTVAETGPTTPLPDTGRLRLTHRHVAYLRIAEGCDRRCSFCAIPSIRGTYTSKPIEQIVVEAEELVADGVREIVVIAQDTSNYGVDLTGSSQLARLLGRLAELPGVEWLRVMYLYPVHWTDALIDVFADGGKVLPYLDLPLQHIDDEILRQMRRPVNAARTERLIEQLRQRIDRLVLRTSLIAGFPGETEAQFERLLEFVRQQRFERLGAFAYSPEEGTAAAGLEGQLPETVRRERRDRILAVQQEIAFDWARSQVGRTFDVIVDRCIDGEKDAYQGRTHADAPDIDPVVYVTGENLAPGCIVPCEIVMARGYDLVAAAVGNPR
ncbi:MAG: 30S ribosomal protein S12 methylthiotransferase RimO [Planctomycetes bacterium]|nr:30S ribosomal protein S12 methylthiotransferase RimO [Planctomycetota bacterium]